MLPIGLDMFVLLEYQQLKTKGCPRLFGRPKPNIMNERHTFSSYGELNNTFGSISLKVGGKQ